MSEHTLTEPANDVTLVLDGLTHTCGICGAHVDSPEKYGYVGLNGVLCESCWRNIGHYTPSWYCFELTGSKHVEMYEFTGYPGAPFHENECGLFLDLSGSHEHTQEELYQWLSDTVQEFISAIPEGSSPEAYTQVVPDWASDHPLPQYYTHQAEEDHPLATLSKYLSRPYAIAGNTLWIDESDVGDRINNLLTTTPDDGADIEQQGFNSFGTDEVDSSPTTTSSSQVSSTQESASTESKQQSGLGEFC